MALDELLLAVILLVEFEDLGRLQQWLWFGQMLQEFGGDFGRLADTADRFTRNADGLSALVRRSPNGA